MPAIAFIGVIQHEVEQAQLRRLIALVKEAAGPGCVVLVNANGLFATASRLAEQIELLFDSGIDAVFLGEQAIARNAGRSVLARAEFPMLRPVNMSETVPGRDKVLLNTPDGPFWLMSVADGTGKIPVSLPHTHLENFFGNKKDDFPVIINVNGTNLEYREALPWKFSNRPEQLLFFGSGTGLAGCYSVVSKSCFLQRDIGSVVVDGSVSGVTPESWWQRNIDRVPANPVMAWGVLRCDYTIVWLNEDKKLHKQVQNTVKL